MLRVAGHKRKSPAPSSSGRAMTTQDVNNALNRKAKSWLATNLKINKPDPRQPEDALRSLVSLPPARTRKMEATVDKEIRYLGEHHSKLQHDANLQQHDLEQVQKDTKSVEEYMDSLIKKVSELNQKKFNIATTIKSIAASQEAIDKEIAELHRIQAIFRHLHHASSSCAMASCSLQDAREFVGLLTYEDVAKRGYDELFATVYTLKALQFDENEEFPEGQEFPATRGDFDADELVDAVAQLLKLEKTSDESPFDQASASPFQAPAVAAAAVTVSTTSSEKESFIAEDDEEAEILREFRERWAKKRRVHQA